MDRYVRLLSDHSGRDKIVRSCAYASMLLAHNSRKPLAGKWQVLASQLSAARTVLRLFDDIPMFYMNLQYGLGKQEQDPSLRALQLVSNLADQSFYPLEHIAWFGEHKLVRNDSPWWRRASLVAWAVSLLSKILKHLVLIAQLRKVKTRLVKRIQADNSTQNNLQELATRELRLWYSLLRLSCDFANAVSWLPIKILWAGKLNLGQNAFFGLVASLIGLHEIYLNKFCS